MLFCLVFIACWLYDWCNFVLTFFFFYHIAILLYSSKGKCMMLLQGSAQLSYLGFWLLIMLGFALHIWKLIRILSNLYRLMTVLRKPRSSNTFKFYKCFYYRARTPFSLTPFYCCRFEVWHINFGLCKAGLIQFCVLILFRLRFIKLFGTFIFMQLALDFQGLYLHAVNGRSYEPTTVKMTVWGHALSLIFPVWYVVRRCPTGARLIQLSKCHWGLAESYVSNTILWTQKGARLTQEKLRQKIYGIIWRSVWMRISKV